MINVKEQAGIRDSLIVYEKLHVKKVYLEEYVHNKLDMDPVYREEIDRHLLNVCNGECQRKIDDIVAKDKAEDWKLDQMPEGDRE